MIGIFTIIIAIFALGDIFGFDGVKTAASSVGIGP
jgi:hypothetical protein